VNLVVAGCSRRKLATEVPVPALDLYQGGCVPALRERLGGDPQLRQRVRILSARHGLVPADQALLPYDRPLDIARALELQPSVTETLRRGFALDGWSVEILAVLEPLYMVCMAGILALPGRPALRWVADPPRGWAEADSVLDEWGW
jgi:uncharacterized protein DUF6884